MTNTPVLFSEDFIFALLLDTIVEACSTEKNGEIDSRNSPSYARAIRELALSGFLDIQKETENKIAAIITEKGNAYLIQLVKEEEEEKAARKR